MDERELWQTFQKSGRVEDYLRYRGLSVTVTTNTKETGEQAYGEQPNTASDDRRPDYTGL